MIKTTYTQNQLEKKVLDLNEERQNAIGKSTKQQIENAINYYISLLVRFDENPTLKTIEA